MPAACAVASAIGAYLTRSFSRHVPVRVLEPAVPDADAWAELLAGAHVVRVCGNAGRAALVVREGEAMRLVCSALEEERGASRPLSPIERRVRDDIIHGMTGALSHLCGPDVRRANDATDEFFTYFEVLAGAAQPARIGIAAGPAAPLAPQQTVRPDDLGHVEVEVSVELARGEVPAARVLDLRPGDVVPMTTRIGEPGVPRLAGSALARGTCGAAGTRFAMMVL